MPSDFSVFWLVDSDFPPGGLGLPDSVVHVDFRVVVQNFPHLLLDFGAPLTEQLQSFQVFFNLSNLSETKQTS